MIRKLSSLINDYPTTDGKPMAETDDHRDLMTALIETLRAYYAGIEDVYVSGNLLLYYVPGNRRRHVSPDVFVVKGVSKKQRPNYLIWEAGKGPDLVVEITSSSTKHVNVNKKFLLYQNVLKVPEYFLFDPLCDYLKPQLQGYRLRRGEYVPIKPVAGRLPSKVLGLHFEQQGSDVRLYDPSTEQYLCTWKEKFSRAEAEKVKMRRELEELRRRLGEQP